MELDEIYKLGGFTTLSPPIHKYAKILPIPGSSFCPLNKLSRVLFI